MASTKATLISRFMGTLAKRALNSGIRACKATLTSNKLLTGKSSIIQGSMGMMLVVATRNKEAIEMENNNEFLSSYIFYQILCF